MPGRPPPSLPIPIPSEHSSIRITQEFSALELDPDRITPIRAGVRDILRDAERAQVARQTRRAMSPTMKEVASRAGVSVKSVSRVVNDHPHISDDVRHRVRTAIAELDWQPNANARTLRTGRTGLIALSLVDLTTPSSSRLAQALLTEADRQGLQVSVEPSRGRPDRVRQTLDSRGALFDAVIHVGPLPASIAPALHEPDRPVLTIWAQPPAGIDAPPELDGIETDEASAATTLARHLRTVGSGEIVVIARHSAEPDDFVDHLTRAFPDALTIRPDTGDGRGADRAMGRELAARALDAAPGVGALLCADDELAIGALSLLRERGLEVPGRVLLTGHGNLEDGRFTTPSLTTIDPAVPEIARQAIDLIRARLAGDRSGPRRVVVPAGLVRAESTLGTPERANPRAGLREEIR